MPVELTATECTMSVDSDLDIMCNKCGGTVMERDRTLAFTVEMLVEALAFHKTTLLHRA